MPYISGFLIEGPVDPGYGRPEGGRPGHDLPSGPPGHVSPPIVLPEPPPGLWPPPTGNHPIVPAPPGTPPGTIWPSPGRPVDPGYGRPEGGPGHPGQPLPPGPGRPDAGLPPAPGRPDQGLPGGGGGQVTPPIHIPSSTFWVVAGIPGVGWRYVAVDPSLKPGMPLPGGPPGGVVSPPIAPTPEPKR